MPYMTEIIPQPYASSMKATMWRFGNDSYMYDWDGFLKVPIRDIGAKQQESRYGTNSPLSALEEFGNFVATSRKVFVGYDERNIRLKRYYTRKGDVHFRMVPLKRKRKKFQTVYFYKRRPKRLKKNILVRANNLDYRRGILSISPESRQSTFELRSHLETPGPMLTVQECSLVGPADIPIPMDNSYIARMIYHASSGTGSWVASVGPPPIIDQKYHDQCITKLYSKVKDDLPSYYTMAAESGEAIDTLRKILYEGIKLARNLYRFNVEGLIDSAKGFKSPKLIAETWLTWVYGIAPVVQDIEDIIRVASRDERVWRSFSTSVDAGSYGSISGSPLLDGEVEHSYRAFVRYGAILESSFSTERYLQQISHWEQQAGVIYEAIPFSFMLDWLVNISDYLNSVNVMEGRFLHGWVSTGVRRTQFHTGDPKFDPYGIEGHAYVYHGSFLHEYKGPVVSIVGDEINFTRNVLYTFPELPVPTVPKSSTFFEGVTWRRALNALAVAVAGTFGLPDRWSRSYNKDLRKININFRGLTP